MINTSIDVNELKIRDILFRPQNIHKDNLKNYESNFGDEIEEEFKKAYSVLFHNLEKLRVSGKENCYASLVLLADGLNILTLIFHSSFLGYMFEVSVLVRYYIENLGMSYSVFIDEELYNHWKNKPEKEYSNKISKKGIDKLTENNKGLFKLWKKFSEISHIEYNTVGQSFNSSKEVFVGGAHTPRRDEMIRTNISASELLLKLTNKLFIEEFSLKVEP